MIKSVLLIKSHNDLLFYVILIILTLYNYKYGPYIVKHNTVNDFEVRHPRCVGSITKNFCVLHNTVEHNYISSSSTVGIQLHVSVLYVGHLQVVI